MYIERMLPGLSQIPGINEYDRQHDVNWPEIQQEYVHKLDELVLLQKNGVTEFYGGPLHLEEDQSVWLSPAEVDDGTNHSYFQVIYINTTPLEAAMCRRIPVSYLEIDEAGFKLTPPDHPGYAQLMGQFTTDNAHVLIRHCETGMAYYPRSITPGLSEKVVRAHLSRLVKATGLGAPELNISIRKPSDRDRNPIDTDLLQTFHSRKYQFNDSDIFSYGLILDDDPWKYYEVLTPAPLEEIDKDNLLIRIDSGCDIGQIFDDRGCDCREQLHTALTNIQEEANGMVIHIPSQDGRGFGAATKMETEGLKRGIEVATNHDALYEQDTISAARFLLGEHFDIRTYDGVGKILGMLGVESVMLQTDNRLKAQGLIEGGVAVTRRRTQTTAHRGAGHHVQAKHRHNAIYFDHEEDQS